MTTAAVKVPQARVEEQQSADRGSLRKRLTGADAVEYIRSLAGAGAVIAGDVAIATAACVVLVWTNAPNEAVVTVLTGAFTAISTMTAAYFGIKAASNTAQSATALAQSCTSPAAVTQTLQPSAGQTAAGERRPGT